MRYKIELDYEHYKIMFMTYWTGVITLSLATLTLFLQDEMGWTLFVLFVDAIVFVGSMRFMNKMFDSKNKLREKLSE